MNNGLQFGMEGPMMEGTWINPETGHKFTVRDCYFENNQFMVMTTDGQMLDYNTIQNYVQCKDGDSSDFTPPSPQPTSTSSVPQEIQDMVLPEDSNIWKAQPMSGPRISSPTHSLGNLHKPAQEEPDMAMVRRVLQKHPNPQINSAIVWEAPVRQIDTLMNILGVEASTIADYYMQFLNPQVIMNLVRQNLADYIETISQEPQSTGFMRPANMPISDGTEIYTTASVDEVADYIITPEESERLKAVQNARPIGGAKKTTPKKTTPKKVAPKKSPVKNKK